LGNLEVDTVLENAREFGQYYVSSKKEDKTSGDSAELYFGKPALLRAAKQ